MGKGKDSAKTFNALYDKLLASKPRRTLGVSLSIDWTKNPFEFDYGEGGGRYERIIVPKAWVLTVGQKKIKLRLIEQVDGDFLGIQLHDGKKWEPSFHDYESNTPNLPIHSDMKPMPDANKETIAFVYDFIGEHFPGAKISAIT